MRKLFNLIFVVILFMPFIIKAKELTLDWQKSFGGNGDDSIAKMIDAKDGGFIFVGESRSSDFEGLTINGGSDIIIFKTDKNNNLLWKNCWGGSGYDYGYNVIETEDESIIVLGSFSSKDIDGLPNKGNSDVGIVKYDKNGNMLWQKSWGGSKSEYISTLIETNDGGFIIAGTSESSVSGLSNKGSEDLVMVKYDIDGNMIWQKSWGGSDYESFSRLYQTKDGSLILIGYFVSTNIEGLTNKGSYDAMIIKYDKDGNFLWQKSWGRSKGDNFDDVIETKDDCLVLVGFSQSLNTDAIIVKYDKDGNMLWEKSWGGNASDSFDYVIETNDEKLIVLGSFFSTNISGIKNKGSDDTIIVKYDKDGNMIYQKSWGGNDSDYLNNPIETEDGNFILFGNSSSTDIEGFPNKGSKDAIILKYDKDGNMLWQKSWGGNGSDRFSNVIETEDESLIIEGVFNSTDTEEVSNNGNKDIIILKYSIQYDLKNTKSENGSAELKQEGKYGIITPTPNEGYEVDNIIVKDVNGNVLDVEITTNPDGTYSFELYDDVTVEVLFKETLVNPKTGLFNYIGLLLSMLVCSLISFWFIMRKDKKFEL